MKKLALLALLLGLGLFYWGCSDTKPKPAPVTPPAGDDEPAGEDEPEEGEGN